MFAKLFIQGEEISLFSDENISIIESVVDIKDITKNTNAFTRTFSVPADAANNLIFRHWYISDIDNSFDARIKVAGSIEFKGKPFKKGTFRLVDVKIENGRATSYTIQFFGELSSIKKSFGKDELSALDLSTFDHSYTPANVLLGLQDGITPDRDIVYTPLSKKQLYVNPEPADNTVTDTLVNISYDGGANTGLQWLDLNPSIRLIKIIEQIETQYNVTFSREFFGHQEFQQLYLWLNNSKDRKPTGTEEIIDWTSNPDGLDVWMSLISNTGSYTVNSSTGEWFKLYLQITPAAGYESVPFTVRWYADGELHTEENAVTNYNNFDHAWHVQGDGSSDYRTYQIYFTVSSAYDFEYSASLQTDARTLSGQVIAETLAASNTQLAFFKINDNIPKMKIIEFMKSIFAMFKLIVIPLGSDSYYVNTIDSFYDSGELHDITPYIDGESHVVKRGEIFNEIGFTFAEGQTLQGIAYRNNFGRGFGDEEVSLEDENGDPLDGESFTLEIGFEQIPIERLYDQTDNVPSNCMYGAAIDESFETVVPKPFIHYAIRTGQSSIKPIGFWNGSSKELVSIINNPSCANDIVNPLYSTTFSAEKNPYTGTFLNLNLYTNHYSSYIDEVFNIKKRKYKYGAFLPERIQLALSLNDVLKIGDSFFRIEKYATNLTTGWTDFDLFNFFSDIPIGTVKAAKNSQQIITDYRAKTEVLNVANVTGATFNYTPLGTLDYSWMTASVVGGVVECVFDVYNGAPDARQMRLDITNNGTTIGVLITQTANTLTADNNVITSDNNFLTADNN
jgi:hypothetical protein